MSEAFYIRIDSSLKLENKVYLSELLRQYNYPTLHLELCTFTCLYGTPLISCWLMLYMEIKGPFSALVLCVISSELILNGVQPLRVAAYSLKYSMSPSVSLFRNGLSQHHREHLFLYCLPYMINFPLHVHTVCLKIIFDPTPPFYTEVCAL